MRVLPKILALGLLIFLMVGCQPQSENVPVFPGAHPTTEPGVTFTPPPTLTPKIQPTQLSPSSTFTPEFSPSPSQSDLPSLDAEIERIIAQSGGTWHIVIKEVDGETLYARDSESRINIASLVKVPLALLFFQVLEANGIPEEQLREYLSATGTGGRTFEQLVRAMLVQSEEDATQILDAYIRQSALNLPAQMRAWGLEMLDLEARRYTAARVADIFERLYLGDFVSPTARAIILEYLSAYTSNDDLRLGALSAALPDEFVVYNKRGSLLTPYVVADCAILENPDGPDYILAIFAYQGELETTYERLEAAIAEIALAFAAQIR